MMSNAEDNQRAKRINLIQKAALVEIVKRANETEVDWEKAASQLNTLGPAVKEASNWKKSFEVLKSKAKRRGEHADLNDLDEKLVSIAPPALKISKPCNKKRKKNKFTSQELLEKGVQIQMQFLSESRRHQDEELKIMQEIHKLVTSASTSLMVRQEQEGHPEKWKRRRFSL